MGEFFWFINVLVVTDLRGRPLSEMVTSSQIQINLVVLITFTIMWENLHLNTFRNVIFYTPPEVRIAIQFLSLWGV